MEIPKLFKRFANFQLKNIDLGPSWGSLGFVLGPSWDRLGPSWVVLLSSLATGQPCDGQLCAKTTLGRTALRQDSPAQTDLGAVMGRLAVLLGRLELS